MRERLSHQGLLGGLVSLQCVVEESVLTLSKSLQPNQAESPPC